MRVNIRLSRKAALLITWAHLLLLSSAYRFANAESSTESPDNVFGLDLDITPSMAMITIGIVCGLSTLAFVSIYLRKCLQSRASAARTARTARIGVQASVRDTTRRRGLDTSVIDTFPVLNYSAVKALNIGKGELECAVCLGEFEDDETLRLLPKCNHVFHPDCIDIWLASRVTCPVCRSKLTPESGLLALDISQSTESGDESHQENSTDEVADGQNDHVVINVDDDQSRELQQVIETVNNRATRSKIMGKFPRSHSTGHSLVQLGENTERYTLRLPEEVSKQVLVVGKLKRSTSYGVVLGRVGRLS